MSNFAHDLFVGTAGTDITAGGYATGNPGLVGGPWASSSDFPGAWLLTTAGRARCTGSNFLDYLAGTPVSPDYYIEIDIYVASVISTSTIAIIGRTTSPAASSFYSVRLNANSGSPLLQLSRRVSGTFLSLGSDAAVTLSAGTAYTLRLSMVGSALVVSWGVAGGSLTTKISVTDTGVTAAGKAGIFASETGTDTTGFQLDRFDAFDILSPQTIAPNHASIRYFPGCWVTSSSLARANAQGSGLVLPVTAAAGEPVSMTVDCSRMGSLTSTTTPIIDVSIDGGAVASTQLPTSGSAVSVPIDPAPSAGSHSYEIWYRSAYNNNAWGSTPTAPTVAVDITSFTIGGGSSMGTLPAARPNGKMAVFGDSIPAGGVVVSTDGTSSSCDARRAWPQLVARALGYDLCPAAFPGTGWALGYGDVPAFYNSADATLDSWKSIYSGAARTMTGFAAILVALGQNGTTVQADVQASLARMRTATGPTTKIGVVVPLSQNGRSAITAAVAALADPLTRLIDPGEVVLSPTVASRYSNETPGSPGVVHPNIDGHAMVAARLVALWDAAFAPAPAPARPLQANSWSHVG